MIVGRGRENERTRGMVNWQIPRNTILLQVVPWLPDSLSSLDAGFVCSSAAACEP